MKIGDKIYILDNDRKPIYCGYIIGFDERKNYDNMLMIGVQYNDNKNDNNIGWWPMEFLLPVLE